jgi:hypothetical protein
MEHFSPGSSCHVSKQRNNHTSTLQLDSTIISYIRSFQEKIALGFIGMTLTALKTTNTFSSNILHDFSKEKKYDVG